MGYFNFFFELILELFHKVNMATENMKIIDDSNMQTLSSLNVTESITSSSLKIETSEANTKTTNSFSLSLLSLDDCPNADSPKAVSSKAKNAKLFRSDTDAHMINPKGKMKKRGKYQSDTWRDVTLEIKG